MMPDDADFFSLDVDHEAPRPALDSPVLNIYLASAMTNLDERGQEEARVGRAAIRGLLERYDHFGMRFTVYDPAEFTPPGSQHSVEEVYVRDHHQTARADLVVFYVLAPSLGVGMEAQIVADCTLPRVVISRRDAPVSRMFRGVFSPTIATVVYGDVGELHDLLSCQMFAIAESAVRSAIQRRGHVAGFCGDALGAKIMRLRLGRELSLRLLAREIDVAEYWLKEIECNPITTATVTLMQLQRIAAALHTVATVSERGIPTIKVESAEVEMRDVERESLKNLVDFAQNHNEPLDDGRVLVLWKEYRKQQREELEEAGRYRGTAMEPITNDEWTRRYNARDGRLF